MTATGGGERPLRVLAVHPYADLYGSDRMFVRSVSALAAGGHDVAAVLGEAGPLQEWIRAVGVPVATVATPILRKSLLRGPGLVRLALSAPAVVRRLVGVLRESSPDVLYVNTVTAPHWLAAARLAGVPAVCHVRELESDAHRLAVGGLLAPLLLAARVLANSDATAAHLAHVWPPLAGRTTVVHNGLRFPLETPEPPRLSGPVTLTVPGRLSPRKGQQVALAALAALRAGGHDVRLRLVGSVFPGYEWFEAELRADAERLGVADRVSFEGYSHDVWSVYVGSDVVLVPSLLEPFGSVAAEAGAMARPLVVTGVGGLPEIVRDGVTGRVVPRDDPAALAAAVVALLSDPERARAMARAAAADVRERFDEERYGRDLVAAVVGASRVRC